MIGFDLVSMAGELSVASTVSEIADSLMTRATSIALEQNPDRPIGTDRVLPRRFDRA